MSSTTNTPWLFGSAWAVRQGPWKLMEKASKAEMLVNLADDPSEKLNLMPNHPDKTTDLMKRHRDWLAEVGNK